MKKHKEGSDLLFSEVEPRDYECDYEELLEASIMVLDSPIGTSIFNHGVTIIQQHKANYGNREII
jgi:hypothetical protein